MNFNIYLIGFSGTGKSTSGEILSKVLKLKFVDMDSEIELREGSLIPEIFASAGEDGFRKLETNLLESISNKEMQVVSTGGGLPTLKENRSIMAETGKIVCLTASAETIYERLLQHSSELGEKADRPMLFSNNPLDRIRELLLERECAYLCKADLIVDTELFGPEEVAYKIIEGLDYE